MSARVQPDTASAAVPRVDTELATALTARLTELETSAVNTLQNALPFEKYQQSCGYLEAVRQLRDVLIPETLEAIQRR